MAILDKQREKITSFLMDVGVNDIPTITNTVADLGHETYLCKISNVNWQFKFKVISEGLVFVNNDALPIGIGAEEIDLIFNPPTDETIRKLAQDHVDSHFWSGGKLSDVEDVVRNNLNRIPDYFSASHIEEQIRKIRHIREKIGDEIFEIGKRQRLK